MTVTAIWRYPVKSMAAEHVRSTQLTSTGLVGDRVVQVFDRRGRMVTARTFPRLLRLHATLGGQLCLNAAVARAGRIEVGNRVDLVAP